MADSLSKVEINDLLEAARSARGKAYAPYSSFPVGAAALGLDGRIYTGCNVENISYGLTNCAERTAIFKSISEGNRGFKAVAIAAGTDDYCFPCGACRQVIAEFGRDILVISSNSSGRYIISTIEELLPAGFTTDMLRKETAD